MRLDDQERERQQHERRATTRPPARLTSGQRRAAPTRRAAARPANGRRWAPGAHDLPYSSPSLLLSSASACAAVAELGDGVSDRGLQLSRTGASGLAVATPGRSGYS